MIYSQRDPRWSALQLGGAGNCYNIGCLVTDIAQALYLAGYTDITPATVINAMNAKGGLKGGLVQWSILTQCFPQIHFGGAGYNFVQGYFGNSLHFVLACGGSIYEPWNGVNGYPSSWRPTNVVRTVAIDPAPAPAPAPTPAPAPGGFPRTVTAIKACNVRSAPHLEGIVTSVLQAGNTFTAVDLVDGDTVAGNNKWFQSSKGHYVWSGNIRG